MAERTGPTVAVNLPKELVAKIEELKSLREADRDRTVDEVIEEMCRSYVRVRERAVKDLARKEEWERSYQAEPFDCRDDWETEIYRAERQA
jgi:hypothetical protein